MARPISINDKTSIGLGLLIVLVPALVVGITAWANLRSQTDRNTSDIVSIVSKLDTLNTNLTTTNGNIIELNTRLDGLAGQQNQSTSQFRSTSATTVFVPAQSPAQSDSGATVALQPQQSPSNQSGTPEDTPPEDDQEETSPTVELAKTVDRAINTLLGVPQ
jgi:uncharacterized protein YlxW (UPF0749 family)